jgi:hypothetical protein
MSAYQTAGALFVVLKLIKAKCCQNNITHMIKFRVTVFFLLVGLGVQAQSVPVKKQKQRLKGENIDGFAVDLEGKKSDVSASLTRYLKEVGKIKFLSSDPLVITDPVFNGNVAWN